MNAEENIDFQEIQGNKNKKKNKPFSNPFFIRYESPK